MAICNFLWFILSIPMMLTKIDLLIYRIHTSRLTTYIYSLCHCFEDVTMHDKPQRHDKNTTTWIYTQNTCFKICSKTTTDEKRFLLFRQQNGIICIYIFLLRRTDALMLDVIRKQNIKWRKRKERMKLGQGKKDTGPSFKVIYCFLLI